MNTKALGLSIVGLLSASSALAQQGAWEYSATFYLFMAETDTSISTPSRSVETTLSFSDALDNLDFAFMGVFEAHNGQWGGAIDVMHLDLSFGTDTPGPVFSRANTDLEMNVVTAVGFYRVYEDQQTAVDLGAGLRWTEVDTGINLVPAAGPGPGPSVSDSVDWVDPIIGGRVRHQFSERWGVTGLVDWGGFNSDSETYQFLLTADYAINENWVVRGGYRYMSFENDDDGVNLDIDQSGPILGITYRF